MTMSNPKPILKLGGVTVNKRTNPTGANGLEQRHIQTFQGNPKPLVKNDGVRFVKRANPHSVIGLEQRHIQTFQGNPKAFFKPDGVPFAKRANPTSGNGLEQRHVQPFRGNDEPHRYYREMFDDDRIRRLRPPSDIVKAEKEYEDFAQMVKQFQRSTEKHLDNEKLLPETHQKNGER